MTFLQINFGYQKALKHAIEIGDWKKVAALKGRHQARLEMNKDTGLRRDENEIAARKALDPTAKVENKGVRAYADRELKNLSPRGSYSFDTYRLGIVEPKAFRKVMKEEAQDIINNSTSKINEYYNDKADDIHNKALKNQEALKKSRKEARKEKIKQFFTGADTYKENIPYRSLEGVTLGGLTGSTIGHMIGKAKSKKVGLKAKVEASRGLKNKILNTIDKNRLNRIEKEARKKVNVTRYSGIGGVIGAGVGAGAGAGAGALEVYLKKKAGKSTP